MSARDVLVKWWNPTGFHSEQAAVDNADAILAALDAAGLVVVPREPTREMLNAAIDTDSFKLGDISPLGFRCTPQQMFSKAYTAMLKASEEPK